MPHLTGPTASMAERRVFSRFFSIFLRPPHGMMSCSRNPGVSATFLKATSGRHSWQQLSFVLCLGHCSCTNNTKWYHRITHFSFIVTGQRKANKERTGQSARGLPPRAVPSSGSRSCSTAHATPCLTPTMGDTSLDAPRIFHRHRTCRDHFYPPNSAPSVR